MDCGDFKKDSSDAGANEPRGLHIDFRMESDKSITHGEQTPNVGHVDVTPLAAEPATIAALCGIKGTEHHHNSGHSAAAHTEASSSHSDKHAARPRNHASRRAAAYTAEVNAARLKDSQTGKPETASKVSMRTLGSRAEKEGAGSARLQERSAATRVSRSDGSLKESLSSIGRSLTGPADRKPGHDITHSGDHTYRFEDKSCRPSAQGKFAGLDKSKELKREVAVAPVKDECEQRALVGAELALAIVLASGCIAKIREERERKPEQAQLPGNQATLARQSADSTELDAPEGKDSDSIAKKSVEDRMKAAKAYESSEGIQRRDANSEADKAPQKLVYDVLSRPTWLVRPQEDLVKLAEHLFQEAEVGWLIADLNAGAIKETFIDGKRVVELKTRQRIVLPVWQDIVKFHKPGGRVDIARLVTIVSETAVDTEVVQNALAQAMGIASAPVLTPALSTAGSAPVGKPHVVGKQPALTPAAALRALEPAKLAVRTIQQAAKAVLASAGNGQDPTAGATATEELQPKYV